MIQAAQVATTNRVGSFAVQIGCWSRCCHWRGLWCKFLFLCFGGFRFWQFLRSVIHINTQVQFTVIWRRFGYMFITDSGGIVQGCFCCQTLLPSLAAGGFTAGCRSPLPGVLKHNTRLSHQTSHSKSFLALFLFFGLTSWKTIHMRNMLLRTFINM